MSCDGLLATPLYEHITRFEKTPSRWPIYIGQFRGRAENDYSKINSSLRQRLKVETLPETYDDELRSEITAYLKTLVSSAKRPEHIEDISYKIERDGTLMASIAAARIAQERAGQSGPIVLLSSANPLRKAERKFISSFGNQSVLLSIPALSYLLSNIPDSGLGADTLRRALFEFGSSGGLRDSERRAIRIIRATEEYDIPWADRGLLQQQLGDAIKAEAHKRGLPEQELRKQLDSGSDPKTNATIIGEALRNLAVQTRATQDLKEAREMIGRLEKQILSLEVAMHAKTQALERKKD